MPQTTMRQIADRAGVSVATVSYVLNSTCNVPIGTETRARVHAIANELGYHRSLLGRSIKQPLRHIGVAVGAPDQTEQTYTAELFAGIREQTLDAGYYPVLQPMPHQIGQSAGADLVRRVGEVHRSKLIDGFIIDKAPFLTAPLVELYEQGVPLVLVNSVPDVRTSDGRPVPIVNVDNRLGASLAAHHLLELGHRRIGLILPDSGGTRLEPTANRILDVLHGYRDAISAAGLPRDDALIMQGDLVDRACTQKAVESMMRLAAAPTALFVADDAMAVMAINALRRLGLSVPGNVSVIGYGDWPIVSRLAEPPLTTVHTPLRDNGRLAAKLLIDFLETGSVNDPSIVIEPRLIVRASTAPCRAATKGSA